MRREIEDAHIYFPKKVLTELRKWAAVNRRSVTAETVIAVEEYIQRMRAEKSSQNGRKK